MYAKDANRARWTAGAASGALSPRPSTCPRDRTHASS
jgi:hypothetical protein